MPELPNRDAKSNGASTLEAGTPRDSRFRNIIGQKFSRLTVRSFAFIDDRYYWLCECDCGNSVMARGDRLRRGVTKSCGCVRKKRAFKPITHGHARDGKKTSEYNSWMSMIARCYNKNHVAYKNYGGRGVTVCDSWKADFAAFLLHVGTKPRDGKSYSIDRIDNNKGYEPGNVKWSTAKEQNCNRRSNHKETFNGVSMCLVEWAKKYSIPADTLSFRLKSGWDFERAITTPVRKKAASKKGVA